MMVNKENILTWLRNKPKDEVVSKKVQPISKNCLVYNFLHQTLFSVDSVGVGAYTNNGERILLPSEVSDIVRAQDKFFHRKLQGSTMSAEEAIKLVEGV